MIKDKILEELTRHNGYVSGENLSELCGVSRTAIWKQIKNLQQAGYPIGAQHGLGYQLTGLADILNEREILNHLASPIFSGSAQVHCFDSVDSTNIVAKKMALAGHGHGTVVITETQTAGKGRLGRAWESKQGEGLWFSLVLEPDISVMEATRFSFLAAVAVAEGVKAATALQPEIKWPNDILINGKKVCGILIELVAEVEHVDELIIGIGVNVNQQLASFPEDIQFKVTSLALEKSEFVPRVPLLQQILQAVDHNLTLYQTKGFAAIKEKWLTCSTLIGKEVSVVENSRELCHGVAVGLDDDGALLIKCADEIKRIIAGDVSLRPADGGYW